MRSEWNSTLCKIILRAKILKSDLKALNTDTAQSEMGREF